MELFSQELSMFRPQILIVLINFFKMSILNICSHLALISLIVLFTVLETKI